MDQPESPPGRQRPCPICGKPAETRFRPFCSSRCADIDLGRWFTERYRIPAGAPEDEDQVPGPGAAGGRP
jgi:endogenous inhibitor of DNA gyrase (YacG/DUF329 family)